MCANIVLVNLDKSYMPFKQSITEKENKTISYIDARSFKKVNMYSTDQNII